MGVRVYIFNGDFTRKKLDNRSQCAYFMGYKSNIVVIIYYKPNQTKYIHRYHNIWFHEYNFRISTEENHTPRYLFLQQDTESIMYNSDFLNLVPCELDLKFTTFCDFLY